MATDKMYKVFSIIPRKGKPDLWLRIGTMYPHANGDGFNILLQAIPLQTAPGEAKIVARLNDPKEDEGDEPEDHGKKK